MLSHCPAIVIPAFSRPNSLSRLLQSLAIADIPNGTELVISLDGGFSLEVEKIAESFHHEHLNKSIIKNDVNLGLRKHILECGNLCFRYDSIILLEDDLIVDPFFYIFATQALDFYSGEEDIAGISLFSYEYNEFINLPFVPMRNGFDTFFMQVACSWGQCWTTNQWSTFIDWYNINHSINFTAIDNIHPAVKAWPESSWKKYFQSFMLKSKKYFVYPYQSYSTNCSDPGGAHITSGTSLHQVSLSLGTRRMRTLLFAPFLFQDVLYDSFMEPVGSYITQILNIEPHEIEIDFQGSKPTDLLLKKKYSLSPRRMGAILKSFAYMYRPVEKNLEYSTDNGHLYLCLNRRINVDRSTLKLPISAIKYYSKVNIENFGFILEANKIFCFYIAFKLRLSTKKVIDKFLHIFFY